MAAGLFTTNAVTMALRRNVIQRAHGGGVGQPRRHPGAGAIEAQRGASFHLAIDFLLFGDEVAHAGGRGQGLLPSEGGEIGAQQEAGAILVGFVDARIELRVLEPSGGRVQTGGKGGDDILGAESYESVALLHGDPGGQMLLLEKLAESGALHFGEEDRQLGLAIDSSEARDHDLFTQVLAGGPQFFQDRPGAGGVAAPPGAQLRAFRHLLVEHFLRLAEIHGQVRDAGEEYRGRGQAAQ